MLAKKVLLIVFTRGSDPGEVGAALERMGYATEIRCPRAGHRLPSAHDGYFASVMFGGPQSANDVGRWKYMSRTAAWVEATLEAQKPFLGICLGSQILAQTLGARIAPHPEGLSEIGYVPIRPTPAGRGLVDDGLHVYHWHHEGWQLPQGAELLAEGPIFPNQVFRYGAKSYGIQFHPEVNRKIMMRWIGSGESLDEPGAQSIEQQSAGNKAHEAAMHAWLARFLKGWLDDAEG